MLTGTAVTSARDADADEDEDEAKEQHGSKVVNQGRRVLYCYEALSLRRGMAVHNPPPPRPSPKSTSSTALLFTHTVNDERLEGGIAWEVSCTPSGSSLDKL